MRSTPRCASTVRSASTGHRALGWLLAGALALPAAGLATSPPVPAARAAVQANMAGLAAFVDGAVAQEIASREVAGAVVTVVQDGQVVFSRGYGFSDAARTVPFDGQSTLVRPGSISKLFTWTALVQLIGAGKVELDAPISRYIDFTVPTVGDQPIRVRDLLSHSPGLSDVDDFIRRPPTLPEPYPDWLKAHVPTAVWKPGAEIAYSNYGAAIAGYIVERVSGEPFDDYVEAHIFGPLGMGSTTFREPLPASMASRMGAGFTLEEGRFVGQPVEYLSAIGPAGSVTTDGRDMATFMLAMLDRGRSGIGKVLTPAGTDLLTSDSMANAPDLPGMAHGYLVYREAGPRLIGHAGKTIDYSSDLVLSPETLTGVFISMTGGKDSGKARTDLSNLIVGRLFPQTPAARFTGEAPAPPLGAYRGNRRDFALPADPATDLKVTMPAPHRIAIESKGVVTAYDQITPTVFERVTGVPVGGPFDRIQFYRTDRGARLAFASQPYMTYHLVEDR